jgi:hypothetical protein
MTEDTGKRLVGHTYVIAFDLGNGRSIQVNGNLYADDDLKSINGKFDGMMAVLERQRARAELEILEAELKARRKRAAEMEFQIATVQAQIDAIEGRDLRSKRPADANQIVQLKAALANHKVNLDRMAPEIEDGIAQLEAGRAKAA